MRRKKIAVLYLICLVLAGCSGYQETIALEDKTVQEDAPESDAVAVTAAASSETDAQIPWETSQQFLSRPTLEGLSGQPGGEALAFEQAGKSKLTYTGDRNFVRYVTTPQSLSGYGVEELMCYDETFFTQKALVLVCETVTSGSVRVEIDSMYKDGSLVSVVLSHEMSGDAGTADMTTWLIWAEVDRDMEDCQWILHNSALRSQSETQ